MFLYTNMYFSHVGKKEGLPGPIIEALEGFLGVLAKFIQDIFCKYLKGYRIIGSILGIWGYNAF